MPPKKKQDLSPDAQAYVDAKEGRTTAQVMDDDTGEISELQIETLSGDIRDAMLTRIRDLKRPWSMLVAEEQSDLANGLDLAARDLVRAAVRLLNNHQWPSVVVTLGEIKIIGGDKSRIEGKIVAPNIGDYRDVLGEHAGQQVMLLAVDSETFLGERAPVQIVPDQPDLLPDDDDMNEAA